MRKCYSSNSYPGTRWGIMPGFVSAVRNIIATVAVWRTSSGARNCHCPLRAICTSIMILAALISRKVPTNPPTDELAYTQRYPISKPQQSGLTCALLTLEDGTRLSSYLIMNKVYSSSSHGSVCWRFTTWLLSASEAKSSMLTRDGRFNLVWLLCCSRVDWTISSICCFYNALRKSVPNMFNGTSSGTTRYPKYSRLRHEL